LGCFWSRAREQKTSISRHFTWICGPRLASGHRRFSATPAYRSLQDRPPFANIAPVAICESCLLATYQELSEFLKSVERRAFKQAYFGVHDEHVALDIVQDSMLKLSDKYADKPLEELPMLFQRILQNVIRDHYRRQKVRNLWTTLFSALSFGKEDEDQDPLETLEAADGSNLAANPAEQFERMQTLGLIEEELGKLPPRQREAFLLRYWEGLDVAQTAEAMGCSEGSVKTHCSRATHSLAEALKAKGIEL
jgi:RNA polymerase sigma-70 factor (ECF subfamily)